MNETTGEDAKRSGVGYTILFRDVRDKKGYGSHPKFSAYFPDIRFPDFSNDHDLTKDDFKPIGDALDKKEWTEKEKVQLRYDLLFLPKREEPLEESRDYYRSGLSQTLEFIWDSLLYQDLQFGPIEGYKRPKLSTIKSIGGKGGVSSYNSLGKVLIPTLNADSYTVSAVNRLVNKEDRVPIELEEDAKAILRVYTKNRESLENLLFLLRTREPARLELLEAHDHGFGGEHVLARFLEKHRLPSNILARVEEVHNEDFIGVPYSIYRFRGGRSRGSESQEFFGLLHGIQFPNFLDDSKMSKEEKWIARNVLHQAFSHAMYHSPAFFNTHGGKIEGRPPLSFLGSLDEEVIISGFALPKNVVSPIDKYSQTLDETRKKMRSIIRGYIPHRKSLEKIAERLREDGAWRKELDDDDENLGASRNQDHVAATLIKSGFRNLIDNPVVTQVYLPERSN